MKLPTYDIEVYNVIKPETVLHYLQENGWSRKENFSDQAQFWAYHSSDGRSYEVLLPLATSISDYASRMDDLFRVLEVVEQRPKDEIFTDLVDTKAIAADKHREILSLHFYFELESEQASRNEASAKHLGAILESLQALFDSIGQVKAGRPSPYGRVAKEITDQTKLSVLGTFKGSFGLRLAVAQQKEQLELIDEPLAELVVQEFFELLEVGHNPERSAFSSRFRQLQKRAASNYRKFLLSLVDANTDLKIDWGSLNPDRGGSASIEAIEAFRIADLIREIEPEQPKEYEITGELLAINKPSQTFLISSLKDGTSFSGKIADSLTDHEFTVPKIYDVTIRETISSSTLTGELKAEHTLIDIRSWHSEDETSQEIE